MAITIGSKWMLLLLLLFTCDANQILQNEDSSHLLMRKLRFKVSDLDYYKRRSLGVNADRVAPGGPAGQHHFAGPTSVL
ncbi:hypothetical protein R6Q57_014749 [Mikania cordata]